MIPHTIGGWHRITTRANYGPVGYSYGLLQTRKRVVNLALTLGAVVWTCETNRTGGQALRRPAGTTPRIMPRLFGLVLGGVTRKSGVLRLSDARTGFESYGGDCSEFGPQRRQARS